MVPKHSRAKDQATFSFMCGNIAATATSSISVLNLCLSLSPTARWAAGRALISSTKRLRFGIFAQASSPSTFGAESGPAPNRHIDNGVDVAQHVFPLREALVEDSKMALRLEGVAVDRVGQLLRCVSAEMH